MKTVSPQTVMLSNGLIDELEEFTYLGNVVSNTGGTDQHVEARLGKAQLSWLWTDCIRKAKIIGRATACNASKCIKFQ